MAARVTILLVMVSAISAANAQALKKDVKVQKGHSVILTRLVNTQADCGPGPVPIPVPIEKPKHGLTQLIVSSADIGASETCPSRKVNAVTIIYSPEKQYVGTDSVSFELVRAAQRVLFGYTIIVEDSL